MRWENTIMGVYLYMSLVLFCMVLGCGIICVGILVAIKTHKDEVGFGVFFYWRCINVNFSSNYRCLFH